MQEKEIVQMINGITVDTNESDIKAGGDITHGDYGYAITKSGKHPMIFLEVGRNRIEPVGIRDHLTHLFRIDTMSVDSNKFREHYIITGNINIPAIKLQWKD